MPLTLRSRHKIGTTSLEHDTCTVCETATSAGIVGLAVARLLAAVILSGAALVPGATQAATLTLANTFALASELSRTAFNFHPQGLGFDTGSNELLFAQQATNRIYRTDLTGMVTGYTAIDGLFFRPNGDFTGFTQYVTSVAGDGEYYYLSDYTGNTSGYDLYSVGKTGGAATALSSETAAYGGYPIDVRDGLLYRTGASSSYNWDELNSIRISKMDAPDTVVQTVALSMPSGIGDIAVDSMRNNVWTLDFGASASLRRFDLATGTLLDVFSLGLDGLTAGITFADDTLYFYDWNTAGTSTLSVYDFVDDGADPFPATIPLPATLPLLAVALGVVLGMGRRRGCIGPALTRRPVRDLRNSGALPPVGGAG